MNDFIEKALNLKKVKIVLFVICALCTCKVGVLYGQSVSHASHYTKSQLDYMMRHGFNPKWNNWQYGDAVDSLLTEAVNYKRGTGGILVLGVATFSVSTALGFLHAVTSSNGQSYGNRGKTDTTGRNIFLFGTGVLVTTIYAAVTKRKRAREKVKSAAHLYRSLNFNDKNQSFGDFFNNDG